MAEAPDLPQREGRPVPPVYPAPHVRDDPASGRRADNLCREPARPLEANYDAPVLREMATGNHYIDFVDEPGKRNLRRALRRCSKVKTMHSATKPRHHASLWEISKR